MDLDFYVPTARLADVAKAATAYVVRAPAHYRDGSWDLAFMTLQYDGCEIEVGGADGARFFDRHVRRWRDAQIDLSRSIEFTILGVRVPTMRLDKLVEYKSALDRDVDRKDIEEMSSVKPERRGSGRR